MTKANEIAQLDAFIASLGPDTYLAPWLAQVRDAVADQIKNDLFPDIMLADSARQVADMRKAADEYSSATRASADQHAKAAIAEAQQQVERLRQCMRQRLVQTAQEFGVSF